MKKTLYTFMMATLAFAGKAQSIADFENLSLPADSFWNGKYNQAAGGFSSGNAFFNNRWDTSFGGYWASGFAYSNKKDSVTTGFKNIYSAIPAIGYNASANYVIGQQGSRIRLSGAATGKVVNGAYFTNTTYAYRSMLDGDAFAKKFGGASGNDSDWFKLSVTGWLNGVGKTDTVHFYLADFRSANNSQDYILRNWTWVDLSSLGNLDSLVFILRSSDNGTFGMNTPAFFAMDHFSTRDIAAGVAPGPEAAISVYPNPASSFVYFRLASEEKANVQVFDIRGQLMHSQPVENGDRLDIQNWPAGIYYLQLRGNATTFVHTLIKQ